MITALDDDGSIEVSLLPFGNKKKFKSLTDGTIRKWEPDIAAYERETRFDTTPLYVVSTIEKLYCRHVPISPNTTDLVKRRHPLYPAQFEEKQAMLRYQTMNELWLQFLKEHNEMAVGMQNPKQPNTAPMLFRNNAPWEMRKAQDTGCLCKPCENVSLIASRCNGSLCGN